MSTPLAEMSDDQIREKVISIVSKELGKKPQEVSLDSKLKEDCGADSLDAVELVLAIEDDFKIEIPDKEAAKIVKVSDIVDVIISKKVELKSI